MSTKTAISLLFYLSALYDGVLGLAFLFAPAAIFAHFCTPAPNHMGYVQFPACLLLIFAGMFFNIARDPDRNRELILYGILLKVSYCAVTGTYWSTGQLPPMWQPFTVCDFLMALAYAWAYSTLQEPAPPVPPV